MNIVSGVNIALRRFLHNHGNIATKGSPKSGLYYTFIEQFQGLFIVHNTIDNTAHSRPLNSLEHCIGTTSMTNIRSGRVSYPVPLSSEPQLDRMSRRGRPILHCQQRASPGECVLIIKQNDRDTPLQGPCLLYALPVAARYTLHFTAPGRVPLGTPTGTDRALVTFSENEDKSPLIAGRAPSGTRQDSGRVSVKHNLIMTTVPGARQGLRSRPTARTGPGPIVT